jgi:short subunit dehydrogenase-like uncharacterized protein
MDTRAFDLIIFGATAFTGRLAAEYMAKNAPPGFKWAIAGRNFEKLTQVQARLVSLPSPPSETIQLDHSDWDAVFKQVARTRVALTFAGPFARYGESVVAACAKLGTHYLDITGETLWVSQMIEKYGEAAAKSGAVLIPFSGFDSVPSDLGTWAVLEEAARKNPDRPVTKIQSLFSGRGGVNGGTFETMLDVLRLSRADFKRYLDPAVLVPDEARAKYDYQDTQWPERVQAEALTAPVFFMATVNSRVVYRSHALRALKQHRPQPAFKYVELQKLGSRLSTPLAWGVALTAVAVGRVGRIAPARKLLKALGPKSGDGPSEQSRENGFFRARFYAYSGDELVAQAEMSYPGDPGNKATVLMACESALCVALGREAPVAGGFWTPSTALGAQLRERLVGAGMHFTPSSCAT